MKYEFLADELLVGERGTDSSPWIKLHMGEYNKEIAGELFKISGKEDSYKITLEKIDNAE